MLRAEVDADAALSLAGAAEGGGGSQRDFRAPAAAAGLPPAGGRCGRGLELFIAQPAAAEAIAAELGIGGDVQFGLSRRRERRVAADGGK